MIDHRSLDVAQRFADRSLPKIEWTHEAHLRVCLVSLATRSEAGTVGFLRDSIRRYNVATGVENTADAGYHETLTRYYVGAVASLGSTTVDDVLDAARCTTDAPRRHWSADLLFGCAARAEWVEPDLRPLPWQAIASGAGSISSTA